MKKIISALLLTVVAGSASIAAPTGGKYLISHDRASHVGGGSIGLKPLENEGKPLGIAVYYEDKNKDSFEGVTRLNPAMFVKYEKRAPAPMYNLNNVIFGPDSDALRGVKEYKMQEQNAKKQNQIIASKNGFTRFASSQSSYIGLFQAAVTTIYKQFVSLFWA